MSDKSAPADHPIRCISSRELSRRTAEVLAEVAHSSRPLMVVRHNQPVALLAPIPGGLFEPIVRQVVQPEEVNSEELERVAADQMQRRVLALLADEEPHSDVTYELDEPSVAAVAVALGRMEIARLVTRQPVGGYRITPRGAAVARALEERKSPASPTRPSS